MIQQAKIGNLTKLTATEGFIHKAGTDIYVKSLIMLPTDSVDMYEEVSEVPPYTKEEYDKKVSELVRQKYSESEEFALQRKAINAAFSPSVTSTDNVAMEEYQAYNAYVDECKMKAKNPELYVHDENEDTER